MLKLCDPLDKLNISFLRSLNLIGWIVVFKSFLPLDLAPGFPQPYISSVRDPSTSSRAYFIIRLTSIPVYFVNQTKFSRLYLVWNSLILVGDILVVSKLVILKFCKIVFQCLWNIRGLANISNRCYHLHLYHQHLMISLRDLIFHRPFMKYWRTC